jgi:hypothetical protein
MIAMITNNQADACLEVYDMKSLPSRQRPLCTFFLPEGGENSLVIDLSISSDTSTRPHPTAPFSVSSQDKLFTVTYETMAQDGENTLKALLFLPMSTILSHLDTPYVADTEQEIPWEQWGPYGAHFISLDYELSDVWVCHTYGMKFALACRPTPQGQFRSVRLYDFNHLPTKRDYLSSGRSTGLLINSNTIEASDEMFAESVHTHLPCRCIQKDLPIYEDGKYEAVMMSEDSLIAVAVGHSAYLTLVPWMS